jgi:hypothetical protein
MPSAADVGARPETWMPSAADVGAAKDADLTAHETDKENPHGVTLAQVGGSNPNLLDNWYFADPINQRGKTEYAGKVYGIDRWKGNSAACLVNVADGCVKMSQNTTSASTASQMLCQYVENYVQLCEKTVTFSALVKSEQVRPIVYVDDGVYGDVIDLVNTNGFSMVSITTVLPSTITSNLWFAIQCLNGGEFEIIAAKLELGSQQTLARQENGVWVLNDPPPNKQQELAKCQSHQVVFDTEKRFSNDVYTVFGSVASSEGSGKNWANVLLYLPSTLRKLPAVSFNALRIRKKDGTLIDISNNAVANVVYVTNNLMQISINTGTVVEINDLIEMALGSGYLILDANL